MAVSSGSTEVTSFICPRNYQWYWNSAANLWSSEVEWMKFGDIENEIIESAFNAYDFEVEIDGDYVIDLEHQIQYKRTDKNKQRPVKRMKLDANGSNVHLRKQRFSVPVSLITKTSLVDTNNSDRPNLDWWAETDFPSAYYHTELSGKKRALDDVVEEAAKGIIKEGSVLNKRHEAKWLADRLYAVELYGHGIIIDQHWMRIPHDIGKTCVFLYTKESFLYKLINRVLREPASTTYDSLKTLGPFCYLLRRYLYQIRTTNLSSVYRGFNLSDDQRKEFIKDYWELLHLTSFTSTSSNREKAEQFGNTILIIDLNVKHVMKYYGKITCGADITNLSDFPDEQEFLIWPGTSFHFVDYEYDSVKEKHLIYLMASDKNL